MSTTITALQSGWLRYAPSQTDTYSTYTYTLPAQYDESDAPNTLIGSHGWDEEYRATWLWDFTGLGLGTITSAVLQLLIGADDTVGGASSKSLQLVNATSSYSDLLARTSNSTSFGSLGNGSTAMASAAALNVSYPVDRMTRLPIPTRSSISLNASALTAINAAIAGSGHFALGGYLTSISVTTMQFAMLHSPTLSAQLVLS